MSNPTHRPTWLHSDRFIARRLGRPLARFLDVEAAGGVVLLVATLTALVWANSPWSHAYRDLWHTELVVGVGGHVVSHDLRHWVNDGLMVLFFFVVGLEIKHELVDGQLSDVRAAALPAVAAAGGMIVPALLFLALNAGGDGVGGWGIPMATDIAFAVGVLALLGDRVPSSLKVLLLALAIVDDIGAIVVIAFFYSDGIEFGWLFAAAAGLAIVVVFRRVRIWYVPVYVALGTAVWFATLESGVHATIAGVVLGLLTPARPLLATADADALPAHREGAATEVRDVSFRLKESVPVAERLEDALHPWTSYVVIPLFALANAGVALSGDVITTAATSRVTLGVVLGLVVGKFLGITGAVMAATKTGVARLPADLTMRQVAGMALLAGIGFTVSLFIAGLAFDSATLDAEAKIGILVASALAAVGGTLLLRTALPRRGALDTTLPLGE